MAGLRDLRAEVRRHLPPIAMGLVIGVAVGVLVMFGLQALGIAVWVAGTIGVVLAVLTVGVTAVIGASRAHQASRVPISRLAHLIRRLAEDLDPQARIATEGTVEQAVVIEAINELMHRVSQREQLIGQRTSAIEAALEQRDTEYRRAMARVGIESSKRRRAESEARRLASAIQHGADAMMVTSLDGTIEYVNPAFERVTGWSREEITGKQPSVLNSGTHPKELFAEMWTTLKRGEVFRCTLINKRRDGSTFHEEKTITPLRDGKGVITHYIASGKDVSDRVKAQEKLEYLAHHDVLTGLPNRALLADRIEQALSRARRDNSAMAVMFLDLDGFKAINDTAGHQVGDRLLAEIANRLRAAVRENDTVARLGGDEFAIILEGTKSMSSVGGIARKLLYSLAAPVHVDGADLYVTTSIGVSRFPRDGEDVHTLLRKADSAMYRAKEAGKNTFRFYSQLEGDEDAQRLELEQQLRRAIERREFALFFQPQMSIDTGTVVGCEALIRWNHPTQGLVMPGVFVPVLEESGLIVEAGDWVLREACRQARSWRLAGLPSLRIAVNVSARQFSKRDLVGDVARILDETGTEPHRLHIEITEGTIAAKFERSVEIMKKLNALGVKIAVDDFGVGYSSLNYLKRLPIHSLKIDRSFIHEVTTDQNDAAIARTIIALAHNLGLDVIAEGVETLEQMFFLSRQGCNEVQGYLVGQPMPPDQFAAWLRENPRVRIRRPAKDEPVTAPSVAAG
jgi:diguanylate cyclase (GGDEF)-like protein/PAS domain S-box-containing protein